MEGHLFDSALATALQICRAAADHRLPIEEMLDHVHERLQQTVDAADAETLRDETSVYHELQALRDIIAAVGDVAAIGSRLPAPVDTPGPIRVPNTPAGGSSLILFAD